MTLNLPNEVLIQIVKNLDGQRDINSICRTSLRFYHLFNDYLYHFNIQSRGNSAILWAAKHGNESTARRILHLGGPINITFRNESSNPARFASMSTDSEIHLGITPLHMAIGKGHKRLVRLFLQAGADSQARMPHGLTPLCLALVSGDEKIVRTVSWHIPNLHSHLIDPGDRLSPLHVASRLGLPGCVRFFLHQGADINARDSRGNTPLHHALASTYGQLGCGMNTRAAHSSDQIFQTVRELLNSGATASLEGFASMTATELGALHQDDRIRQLFGVITKDSAPRHPKPCFVQVGRVWMSSDLQVSEEQKLMYSELSNLENENFCFVKPIQVDRECLIRSSMPSTVPVGSGMHATSLKSRGSNRDAFPVLSENSIPVASDPQLCLGGSRWSEVNTKLLMASFVSTESTNPPATEHTAQADPFPSLISKSERSRDDTPINIWATFRQSEALTACRQVDLKPESRATDSTSSRRVGMRGKSRWQPLTL